VQNPFRTSSLVIIIHRWPRFDMFGYFDLQIDMGFAVLVSWCPVKLLENSESRNQKLP
jgi:hypothetical protein